MSAYAYVTALGLLVTGLSWRLLILSLRIESLEYEMAQVRSILAIRAHPRRRSEGDI